MKSGQYSRLEEDWSRIAAGDKPWERWKRLARDEYDRVEARLAAQGGPNSFGGAAANASAANPYGNPGIAAAMTGGGPAQGTAQPPPPTDEGEGQGLTPEAVADIETIMTGYANAASADASSIEELTRSVAALTRTNESLTAELAKALGLVRSLHAHASRSAKMAGQNPPAPLEEKPNNPRPAPRQPGGRAPGRGRGAGRGAGAGRGYVPRTTRGPGGQGACGICGWSDHQDAKCWELSENAATRPSNWKSCL